MSDPLDERRKAFEGAYFEEENRAALERLRKRSGAKIDPVSGKEMLQKTIHGVVVDQCPENGGIYLDAGELENMLKNATHKEHGFSWLREFFKEILGQN